MSPCQDGYAPRSTASTASLKRQPNKLLQARLGFLVYRIKRFRSGQSNRRDMGWPTPHMYKSAKFCLCRTVPNYLHWFPFLPTTF